MTIEVGQVWIDADKRRDDNRAIKVKAVTSDSVHGVVGRVDGKLFVRVGNRNTEISIAQLPKRYRLVEGAV